MTFFETQGDEEDKERVMLNLIQLANQKGNILERSETEKEIGFKGKIIIYDEGGK